MRTDVVLALWRLASVGDELRTRLTEALTILDNLKVAAMLESGPKGMGHRNRGRPFANALSTAPQR